QKTPMTDPRYLVFRSRAIRLVVNSQYASTSSTPRRSVPARDGRTGRVRAAVSGSVCMAVHEHPARGQQQDLDVQHQGPVLDVINIVDGAVGNRGIAPQVVDLSPAGDPRLDLVPFQVARDLGREPLHEEGPFGTRPDQAHLAPDDVDQ